MILVGCVPELGQRCGADDDCAATERCDPPGWCVPRTGASDATVDTSLDAAADAAADARAPDAQIPDADVPDVSVPDAAPDAFAGCGAWVAGGVGCVPPEPACEEGETALARGCLPPRPECGDGWHETPGGCVLDEAPGCPGPRLTAGPLGCIPERACPPTWASEPCRRRVQVCQPSQVSAPDGGCRPIRPSCVALIEDPNLMGGPVVWVRPGPPVPEPEANGTSAAPFRGIGTALAAEPDAVALILTPGVYEERADLQRALYLRGTCEAEAAIVAGFDIARDVRLAHLTIAAPGPDEPAIAVAGASLTMADVQITGGNHGLLAEDALIDATDLRVEGAGLSLVRAVDSRLLLRHAILRGGAGALALDSTDTRLELTDLTVSVSGLRLRGAGGTVNDVLFTGSAGTAIDEAGTADGLVFNRVTVQGDGDAPALRFGASSLVTLDDVSVDGQPALVVGGGDVRLRGVSIISPRGPLIRLYDSAYVLVTQALLAGTSPIAEVGGADGPGHLGLTATRLVPAGDQPAVQVATRSSLGLRDVRLEGFAGTGLQVNGPAPDDLPSIEARGLRLVGTPMARLGVELLPDAVGLLDQVIVTDVGEAAVRVDQASLTLTDALLALDPVADVPPAAALDHQGGTLTGSRLRLAGDLALQVAAGAVTLDQVAALGASRGVHVTGGEAHLEGARVEGQTGASATGALAHLRLVSAFVNGVDAPPALVGVAAAGGADVSLTRVGVGGQAGQRVGLLAGPGGALRVEDVRVNTEAGIGVAVEGGALAGEHLRAEAPELAALLLPGTDVALRYVLTAALQGIVYRGPAPDITLHAHVGAAEAALRACEDDCPAAPTLP
ncbi:MAG: hypothetical protein H6706_06390 [Myxococcales bacterium]|nr:hypothetical protein [Myxococcales bacterium]